jgi:ArsR family transcriptional regulator, cadmium/lead-responsive transcriptional repressor
VIGPSTRLNENNLNAGARGGAMSAIADSRLDGHRLPGHAAHSANGDGRRLPAPGADGAAGPTGAALPGISASGELCRLLSLLADKTRLRILRILAGGERPVVALTNELRLPQPTVSHHLAWLRMMDLVSPRRQGKHVFYALGAAAQCDESGTLTLTANEATVTITPNPVG